jgi:hypothetical protein
LLAKDIEFLLLYRTRKNLATINIEHLSYTYFIQDGKAVVCFARLVAFSEE